MRKKIEQQSFQLFYKSYEPLNTTVQNTYFQEITTLMEQSKNDKCVNIFLLTLLIIISFISVRVFLGEIVLRMDKFGFTRN